MTRRMALMVAVLAGLGLVPARAGAQSLGIGPRFSFVKGDAATNVPMTRFIGGTLRMVTSPHTVLEASLDYRGYYNQDKTERTRETPLQASLLLFPVRRTLAPYVGGGIGIYSVLHDTLGPAGIVASTTMERKIGWHLGAGAEIRIAKHASLFADYRFRFVKFGEPTGAASEIPVPGSSLIPGFDKIHLSHEGSMWTSGVAFYF